MTARMVAWALTLNALSISSSAVKRYKADKFFITPPFLFKLNSGRNSSLTATQVHLGRTAEKWCPVRRKLHRVAAAPHPGPANLHHECAVALELDHLVVGPAVAANIDMAIVGDEDAVLGLRPFASNCGRAAGFHKARIRGASPCLDHLSLG